MNGRSWGAGVVVGAVLARAGLATAAPGDAAAAGPTPVCQAEQAAADPSPTSSTLSALGECLERAGKLVRAEATFARLADLAKAAGDADAEANAARHVAALDARTPKLRVDVAGDLGDLQVELDGAVLGSSELGVARPVDPGDHRVRVLRGQTALKTDEIIVIEMSKQTYTVDVAAVLGERAPATAATPPTDPAVPAGGPSGKPASPGPRTDTALDLRAPDEGSGSSVAWMGPVGTASIAVGTVGVLTFVGLEVGALATKGTADCTTLPGDVSACTPVGFDQLATARTVAEAGQWVGIGGAIVLATGIGFAIGYGASGAKPTTALVVVPSPSGATLTVGGAL